MFIFDITREDSRLRALSVDGISPYKCESIDSLTGQSKEFFATPDQLSAIIALMIDPHGAPSNVDNCYAVIGDLFKDFPNNLRPIP